MSDPRLIRFSVKANQLTLAPLKDVPVFCSSDTDCAQCRNCKMVFYESGNATYDPMAGHICEQQVDASINWTNWGLSIKDPGPDPQAAKVDDSTHWLPLVPPIGT